MRRHCLEAALAAALLGTLGGVSSCASVEEDIPPPSLPEAAPAPADEAPPAPASPPSVPGDRTEAPRQPAGLLRFPGGRSIWIGISREEWRALIESCYGPQAKIRIATLENGFSECIGEHFVSLPPFWIGKYEVTNAQYQVFLQQAGRVEVVVPAKEVEGPHTLEEVARTFLLAPPPGRKDKKVFYLYAVPWEGLRDINLKALAAAGIPFSEGEAFRNQALPAGTTLVAYRYTVPRHWRVKYGEGKVPRTIQQDAPPEGTGDLPVAGISLIDAMACARFFGCHIPTEEEWEACARGPGGEIWPTGAFQPMGMAWQGYNFAIEKAKADARRKMKDPSRLSAAERAACEWILGKATAFKEPFPEPPLYPVGGFPLGAAPCGALDMLGNVSEWVSTPLTRYPGSDSASPYLIKPKARVVRGGNFVDPEIFLEAVYRAFLGEENSELAPYSRYHSVGFRMARYDAWGASAALPAVLKAMEAVPPVLPGVTDPESLASTVTGLDIHRAIGLERLDEVPWNAANSPADDPPGKVFHLGQAHSLAVVPVDWSPFEDVAGILRAADQGGDLKPRERPFFGLLHMTDRMVLKGLVRVVPRGAEPVSWQPGVVKGSDHPEGFLIGMTVYEGERRPALWEARAGTAATDAPGGSILLEPPAVILERGAIEIGKAAVSKDPALPAVDPYSFFDPQTGDVRLHFHVPGAARGTWFEIRLELWLAEWPAGR